MPNVLVRDLDAEVLERLKAAAKANRRSLQAEIHDVLRRAILEISQRPAVSQRAG